ncbi:MAG: hypothetical protein ACI4NP_02145 [Thermoguttaceae bacterium]
MQSAIEEEWKKDDVEVQDLCDAFLKNDSAVQLILENTPVVGVDGDTGTIILSRTEDGKIFKEANGGTNVQAGERTYHNTGACESHAHIKTTSPNHHAVTAVRTPFSRIHGLWFIQRHSFGNMKTAKDKRENDTMFKDPDENEITADTHGLVKVFLGYDRNFSTSAEVIKGLKDFEANSPNETILKRLK